MKWTGDFALQQQLPDTNTLCVLMSYRIWGLTCDIRVVWVCPPASRSWRLRSCLFVKRRPVPAVSTLSRCVLSVGAVIVRLCRLGFRVRTGFDRASGGYEYDKLAQCGDKSKRLGKTVPVHDMPTHIPYYMGGLYL